MSEELEDPIIVEDNLAGDYGACDDGHNFVSPINASGPCFFYSVAFILFFNGESLTCFLIWKSSLTVFHLQRLLVSPIFTPC